MECALRYEIASYHLRSILSTSSLRKNFVQNLMIPRTYISSFCDRTTLVIILQSNCFEIYHLLVMQCKSKHLGTKARSK